MPHGGKSGVATTARVAPFARLSAGAAGLKGPHRENWPAFPDVRAVSSAGV